MEIGSADVSVWGQHKNPCHKLPPPIDWYTPTGPSQQWRFDVTMQIMFRDSEKGDETMRGTKRRAGQSSLGSRLRRWQKRNPKQDAYHQAQLEVIEENVWGPIADEAHE